MEKNNYATVEVPSIFTSSVDIIIPYHGQYEKVSKLLESIFRLTRSNYYKIYVVDDASPNQPFLQTIAANAAKNAARRGAENVVTTLRTESQLGFAGAARTGFEAGENPYVCFVNSDCLIENTNWLRAMGESLIKLKDQGVRMVAPTTNNHVDGDPAQCREKFARDGDPDVVLESPAFLTMYCFMCHRMLFQRCGGFLREYQYGLFEDQEFAYRMSKRGYKQAVARQSWVYHEGSATIRELWRRHPDLRGVMEQDNRQRCIADMKSLGAR